MPRTVFALSTVALVALGACGGLGPAEDLEVYVSASPDYARVGDTINLVGVAYNGSDVTILSSACGPGIRFVSTDSLGVETELLSGAWTCPVRDSNELLPGETDTFDWPWVPPGPGLWSVVSYVNVDDGPTIYSRPQEVRVIVDPAQM